MIAVLLQVPVARYIDWILTTPLMIYEICHVGGAPYHIILMAIGCDELMLSAGIVAACLDRRRDRSQMTAWFCMGCIFFAALVYTLHSQVAHGTALQQTEDVQRLFRQASSPP